MYIYPFCTIIILHTAYLCSVVLNYIYSVESAYNNFLAKYNVYLVYYLTIIISYVKSASFMFDAIYTKYIYNIIIIYILTPLHGSAATYMV